MKTYFVKALVEHEAPGQPSILIKNIYSTFIAIEENSNPGVIKGAIDKEIKEGTFYAHISYTILDIKPV